MVYPFGFKAERRSKPIVATFPVSHCSDVGLAQPTGRPEQRIEHGSKVECRAADDLEHVGGRSLLLQRFLEIAGLCLHLIEQPGILDGDHRLVGKGLQQLDMVCRECSGLLARDRDDPDRTPVAVHRHKQHAAIAARSRRSLRRRWYASFCLVIRNLRDLAVAGQLKPRIVRQLPRVQRLERGICLWADRGERPQMHHVADENRHSRRMAADQLR